MADAAASWAVVTLRFDVVGGRVMLAHGPGSTLMKPSAAGSTAVTLTVAAVAAGIEAGQRTHVDGQQAAGTNPLLGDAQCLLQARSGVDQAHR